MSDPLAGPEKRRAFLIRWWQEGDLLSDDEAVWRFSLEEVGGHIPRRGFTTLEALFSFLQAELRLPTYRPASQLDLEK